MVIKQTIKQWCQKAVITSLLFVATLFLLPVNVLASAYGSGSYGSCKYSQGCTSTGAPKPSVPTSNQSTTILLNEFPEFFTDAGKTFDLSQSQVVNLNITISGQTTTYSMTIKQIGTTFVVIGYAPKVFSSTIDVNNPSSIDVNGDGVDDVIITLNSITNGKANITFKKAPGASVPETSITSEKTAPTQSKSSGKLWLWLILSLLAIFFAIFIFIVLWRRRHDDDDQNPPNQTIQPSSPTDLSSAGTSNSQTNYRTTAPPRSGPSNDITI